MKVEFTRRFVSPPVVTAAKAMQDRHRLRFVGRKPTKHVDTVLDDPNAIPRNLLSVPSATYYVEKSLGHGKVELCVSHRDGTPQGKPFQCSQRRLDDVMRDRHIFAVVVRTDPTVKQIAPEQWRVLRAACTSEQATMTPKRRPGADPLAQLHGKAFHSLRDLGSALARRECGLPPE